MAEEVGAAYVSLIPSARNFSKIAQREIDKELRGSGKAPTIRVTPEIEATEVQKVLTAQLTGAAQRVTIPADVEVDTQRLNRQLVRTSRQESLTVDADVDSGDLLRDTRRAVREVEATAPTIEIDTKVDRDRLRRSLTTGAASAATEGGTFLGRLFTSGFGSSLLNPLIGIPLLIAGVLSLPILGAAVAAATLAGASLGVIFAGAFALRANPALQSSAASLLRTINDVFEKAAAPLVGPFTEALAILAQAFVDLGPDLRDLFAGVAPYIPILAEGVAGFLKAFTPGLVDAVIRSAPVIERLAWALPDLGDALGDFLMMMADVAPEAGLFIGMLIRGLGDLLRLLGLVLSFAANTFGMITRLLGILGDAFQILFGVLSIVGAIIFGDLEFVRRTTERVVGQIISLFHRLGTLIPPPLTRAFSKVAIAASQLPGRILGALAKLPAAMFRAGVNIIQSLINGIRQATPGVGSAMGAAAALARAFWPFSPAKMGPLSGKGSLFYAGQNMVTDLTRGIEKRGPAVASASTQLAAAASFGARGSVASAPAVAEARWADGATGDPLLDALRDMISIRYGGSPTAALSGNGRT